MVWDLWTISITIYTFLVIGGILEYISIGNMEVWKQRLFSTPTEWKFFVIVFTYIGIVVVYFVFKDLFEDINIIVNLLLFLLPLFFFYKIYDDGVKNKGYSELDSFTYVTYLVGWIILGPFSLIWWFVVIKDLWF